MPNRSILIVVGIFVILVVSLALIGRFAVSVGDMPIPSQKDKNRNQNKNTQGKTNKRRMQSFEQHDKDANTGKDQPALDNFF